MILLRITKYFTNYDSQAFKKIKEAIHVSDNETTFQRNDRDIHKLYKVRLLIEHLNKKIAEDFKPSCVLTVDESMMPFKGYSKTMHVFETREEGIQSLMPSWFKN